jgi:hypothetical protein
MPDEFCHWLHRFLVDRGPGALTPSDIRTIRQHLSDFFCHEIDPLMGDAAHQALLQFIHAGLLDNDALNVPPGARRLKNASFFRPRHAGSD